MTPSITIYLILYKTHQQKHPRNSTNRLFYPDRQSRSGICFPVTSDQVINIRKTAFPLPPLLPQDRFHPVRPLWFFPYGTVFTSPDCCHLIPARQLSPRLTVATLSLQDSFHLVWALPPYPCKTAFTSSDRCRLLPARIVFNLQDCCLSSLTWPNIFPYPAGSINPATIFTGHKRYTEPLQQWYTSLNTSGGNTVNPKKRITVTKKTVWIEIFLNFEMGGPLPRRPFLGPYFDECIFD